MSLAPFSSPRAAPEPLTFREARDRLLELSDDYHGARAAFSWPRPHEFNWALEWFDAELAAGEHGRKTALKVIGERVETRTFAELRRESSRLANGLRALGAKRGDRLLMMLGVVPELWATMLASMKLGLVLIPAMPTLGQADIADRIERGQAKYLVAHGADAEKFAGLADGVERIAVGEAPSGWRSLRLASRQRALRARRPDQGRRPDAPLFHLGHDGALEARRAHPCELSDRASLDDVRARPQARRRASQHFLARLGEARLVERVRALERRRDHHRARLALRAARGARRAGRASGHGVLRAADRLADADPA